MTKLTLAMLGIGLVVGALTIPDGGPTDGNAVVTFGEVLPPILEPRVRAVNDRVDAVDIWFSARGAAALRLLGTVPAMATTTFIIPADATQVRLLVLSQATRERFESEPIGIPRLTEVTLEIAPEMGQSTVEAQDLRVALLRGAPSDST